MARPKSLGAYAPLSATYSDDDAILEAGEKAELLFVRGLAFCSGSSSDGFISDRQVVAKVGAGLTGVPARAKRLVEEEIDAVSGDVASGAQGRALPVHPDHQWKTDRKPTGAAAFVHIPSATRPPEPVRGR